MSDCAILLKTLLCLPIPFWGGEVFAMICVLTTRGVVCRPAASAESQPQPQSYWIRIYILPRASGDSNVHQSLRNNLDVSSVPPHTFPLLIPAGDHMPDSLLLQECPIHCSFSLESSSPDVCMALSSSLSALHKGHHLGEPSPENPTLHCNAVHTLMCLPGLIFSVALNISGISHYLSVYLLSISS